MKTTEEVEGVLEPIFNNDGSIRCVFIHVKRVPPLGHKDENTQQIDIEHDNWVFTIASSPDYLADMTIST
jgi:hypothetical protein